MAKENIKQKIAKLETNKREDQKEMIETLKEAVELAELLKDVPKERKQELRWIVEGYALATQTQEMKRAS